MKRLGRIAPLLLLVMFSSFISLVFAHISISGGGALPINYVAANKGLIMFDMDYSASRVYFSDGYLWINNIGTYSSLGFMCDTAVANMTITKVVSDEITYTVNAASFVTSTTKIYVGAKGRPSELSGSSSWSYSSSLKVVTVNVLHQSPADIVFLWGEDNSNIEEWKRTSYYPNIVMMGTLMVVMAVSMVMGALNGDLNAETVLAIVKIALISGILVAIGVYIT